MNRIHVDRIVMRASGAVALTALIAGSAMAQSLARGKGSAREGAGARVVQTPLDHIVITASSGSLFTGVTLAHAAKGIWKDGTERKLSPIWRSSDPAIATVDGAGNVTARKSGLVTITAEADGVRGTKTYAITARPAERFLIDLPSKPIRAGDII